MEGVLYENMLSSIQCRTYSHFEGIEVFGTEKASKDCERIAIHAQIDLLNDLQKDTENTNAKFRLKLIVKINELENQLSKK